MLLLFNSKAAIPTHLFEHLCDVYVLHVWHFSIEQLGSAFYAAETLL